MKTMLVVSQFLFQIATNCYVLRVYLPFRWRSLQTKKISDLLKTFVFKYLIHIAAKISNSKSIESYNSYYKRAN